MIADLLIFSSLIVQEHFLYKFFQTKIGPKNILDWQNIMDLISIV